MDVQRLLFSLNWPLYFIMLHILIVWSLKLNIINLTIVYHWKSKVIFLQPIVIKHPTDGSESKNNYFINSWQLLILQCALFVLFLRKVAFHERYPLWPWTLLEYFSSEVLISSKKYKENKTKLLNFAIIFTKKKKIFLLF